MRWFRKSKISAWSTARPVGPTAAAVTSWLMRASVEVPGAVPEPHSGLLGHGREPDGVGDAASPYRPWSVGAGQSREAGQWRKQMGKRDAAHWGDFLAARRAARFAAMSASRFSRFAAW